MSKAKMYGCFKPVKRNCTPPKWGKVPRGNKEKQIGCTFKDWLQQPAKGE